MLYEYLGWRWGFITSTFPAFSRASDSNIVQALRGHFAFVEDRLIKSIHRRFGFSALYKARKCMDRSWKCTDWWCRYTKDASGNLVVNGEKYYSTGLQTGLIYLPTMKWTTVMCYLPSWNRCKRAGWLGWFKTTGSGTLKVHQVHLPASFHLINVLSIKPLFIRWCNINRYCACRSRDV